MVTHNTWFGGVYQDPANFFAHDRGRARAVPEDLPGVQAAARADEGLAGRSAGRHRRDAISPKRFGWKIGDRIPIQGTICQPKSGGTTWEFNLGRHLRRRSRASTRRNFFFRYDYLDENRHDRRGDWSAGTSSRSPTARKQSTGAGASFDAMFANSSAETKTTTEKGFIEGFAKQIGDIGSIMIAILVAVLFTLLLVVGQHHGAGGARADQRAGGAEDARLLGRHRCCRWCSPSRCSSRCVGGGLGLLLAWLFVQQGDPTGGLLPAFVPARRATCAGRGADGGGRRRWPASCRRPARCA